MRHDVEAKPKKVFIVIVCSSVAVALGLFVAAAAIREGGPAETAPPDPSPEIEAAPSRAAGEAPEASRFINLEAYGFLGDAARASFVREFSTHLAAQGVPEGEFVMCYSRVEGDGEACTAWASCPNGERFWQISYDLASKAFSFEALEGVPDGLPEINYEALEPPAGEPVHSEEATPALEDPAGLGSSTAGIYCSAADKASLSKSLPAGAAEALGDAIKAFGRAEGRDISVGDCLVALPSIEILEDGARFLVRGADFSASVLWSASDGSLELEES